MREDRGISRQFRRMLFSMAGSSCSKNRLPVHPPSRRSWKKKNRKNQTDFPCRHNCHKSPPRLVSQALDSMRVPSEAGWRRTLSVPPVNTVDRNIGDSAQADTNTHGPDSDLALAERAMTSAWLRQASWLFDAPFPWSGCKQLCGAPWWAARLV